MEQDIYLLGLNHRTAEVAVRERYALADDDPLEKALLADLPLKELFTLSTCNRVEILAVGPPDPELMDRMLGTWAAAKGGSAGELGPAVYGLRGLDAVRHLLTVASSLDSMVLGEPQILGQIKKSYRTAMEKGHARVIINRLLHKAFFTAKRVRTETAVASSAVSISYAAVELAKRIFGDMAGKRAMLVGAGEMAELAAQHLRNVGVNELTIANRTFARARELADRLKGEPIMLQEMFAHMASTDIVISSTGATETVIKASDIRKVMKKRRHKPMFFIDIAVPRDIDPDVNQLDNVYLYDIDDLKEVVEENLAQRKEEAVKAAAIVDSEAAKFGQWLNSLDLYPTIVDLFEQAENVAEKELAKTLKRLGGVDKETRDALEILVQSVGRKILHEPITFLKRRAREEENAERFIDLARRMFNLDRDVVPENAHLDRKTRTGGHTLTDDGGDA